MTAAQQLARQEPRDRARTEDAEEAVLGAIMLDASVLPGIAKVLLPDDFIHPKHRRIFGAMLTLLAHGSAVDPITLVDELERRGQLASVGGREFIGALYDVVPTAANVPYHTQLVCEASQRRALTKVFDDGAARARAGELAPAAIADGVRAALQRFQRATDADGEGLFRILSDTEIDALPEPEPLIEGVAFANTIVALIGAYGTLKTFVLLDMMLSIATGTPWHGRRVQQGAVLYVYAEGSSGIACRVAAWKEAHAYSGSAPIHFLPHAVKITEPAQVAKLLAAIAALGLRPTTIVIDTVARAMTGSEDSVEDMGRFIDGCDTISRALGATVFCAHHTGWNAGRSRGSSALPGAVATELLLERDDMTVTISCTKQKDAAPFEPIRLSAYPVGKSLAFRALAPHTTELTRNELRACHVVLASEGLSSKQWMEDSTLAHRSFHTARKRLTAIGYVTLRNRLYVPTDALKIAIGAGCQTGAEQVPTAPTTEVPTNPISLEMGFGTSPALARVGRRGPGNLP